jgi:hypothetical protein
MKLKLLHQWWILKVRLPLQVAYVSFRAWWHQCNCPHLRHYPDINGKETCRECDAELTP